MKIIKEKNEVKGIAYRRLFDRNKFLENLKNKGFSLNDPLALSDLRSIYKLALGQLPKVQVDICLNMSAKPMFADNFIWKMIYKLFHLDLKIPFITGYWTTNAIKANLIVNTGHKKYADQVGGTTTVPVTAIALGLGTTAAAATDTQLQSEIVSYGGQRGAATVTNTITSTAGDTEQWVKTFNFTGSYAVTEEGLLDNNSSGGILLAHQIFSAVNVANGDSLQITHKIQS